ncbi:hypothetical protein AQY21_18965 [Paracoccus sp. MKU1]|nr:hypothetical protein AQY21_18965 [Paracoccus sp. MKU1]
MFIGVEVDAQGKVIGYHVRRAVDSSLVSSWESEFLHSDQCVLLFERKFPGQLRGIPRGAQVLQKMHMGDIFLDAAIAKARTEACLTVFLSTPTSSSTGRSTFFRATSSSPR